jgi:hypothetical protein
MVSVSGYLIGNQHLGKVPLPPEAELQWWYQYYFATERGRDGYEKYTRDFAKLIWRLASPKCGALFDGAAWLEDASFRVVRDASWHNEPELARSAIRFERHRKVQFDTLGFRVTRTLNP